MAEILYGFERLPTGRRKRDLRQAAVAVFTQFAREILPFDAAAAPFYAEIVDGRQRAGTCISGFDGQIAAAAERTARSCRRGT